MEKEGVGMIASFDFKYQQRSAHSSPLILVGHLCFLSKAVFYTTQ